METLIPVPKLRKGYRLDIADTPVYYYELDHDRSYSNTYLEYFNLFVVENNWHRFIRPGSTVVDIGGHTGDTAVIMQYLARGTVLAVEPIPVNKACMDLNCLVNQHLGRFITASEAVTTENINELEIFDHNNGLLNGGMIDPTWSPELQVQMRSIASESIRVQGLTLESLCQKYLTAEEIENISFIKTDTEGHDVSIINSSRDFIDRIRPVIFAEWFGSYGPAENQHMFDVIDSIGYQAFDPVTLEPADITHKIDDLLLIHSSKVSEYL